MKKNSKQGKKENSCEDEQLNMKPHNPLNSDCATCPHFQSENLSRMGLDIGNTDFVVALAGNPNTGKSTVFNVLTGLRQHTGNWPGKTVTRAEGAFKFQSQKFKIIDLPGTYSLLSTSEDEQVARDFLLFGKPHVTVIVVDASRLERNLNLALQVLEIDHHAVMCLNLIDEAKRNHVQIDDRALSRRLGIPVVPTSARYQEGIPKLLYAIHGVANGDIKTQSKWMPQMDLDFEKAIVQLEMELKKIYPTLHSTRWIAMRMLEGDKSIIKALKTGELEKLIS